MLGKGNPDKLDRREPHLGPRQIIAHPLYKLGIVAGDSELLRAKLPIVVLVIDLAFQMGCFQIEAAAGRKSDHFVAPLAPRPQQLVSCVDPHGRESRQKRHRLKRSIVIVHVPQNFALHAVEDIVDQLQLLTLHDQPGIVAETSERIKCCRELGGADVLGSPWSLLIVGLRPVILAHTGASQGSRISWRRSPGSICAPVIENRVSRGSRISNSPWAAPSCMSIAGEPAGSRNSSMVGRLWLRLRLSRNESHQLRSVDVEMYPG